MGPWVACSASAGPLVCRASCPASIRPLVLLVAGGVISHRPGAVSTGCAGSGALDAKSSGQESRLWSLTSKALHSDVGS